MFFTLLIQLYSYSTQLGKYINFTKHTKFYISQCLSHIIYIFDLWYLMTICIYTELFIYKSCIQAFVLNIQFKGIVDLCES